MLESLGVSKTRRTLPGIGCAVLLLPLLVGGHSRSHAGDWPQILGPHRDGIADNESLVAKLPEKGPRVVWQRQVGEGFAGVAIAGGKCILFHREGKQELVEAHEAATGRVVWREAFPAKYAGGVASDKGPRCVPLIHEDRVLVCGAAGELHCLALRDGQRLWSREAAREYGAPDGYFGAGSTPIVEGDKVLLNVGGKDGAGIVAFSLTDGKTVWKETDEQSSYSSPTAVTHDGVRHVIFVTRLNALSIDPQSGKVRWKFPFGARGPTVNAATPLAVEGTLFLSASYGVGAVFARFDKSTATTVWANNDTMSSQYATCVRLGDYLYGSDGRHDVGSARLRCFEAKTGKVQWSQEDFGVAALILADRKLVIVRDDGTLILAEANPQKYRELGKARIFSDTTRALPALASGLLYVRDTSLLKCLDLRGKASD
ncbi:MAG: PQQ-binding-like beta-propeller repeat protein [Planctomycetales bacterium]